MVISSHRFSVIFEKSGRFFNCNNSVFDGSFNIGHPFLERGILSIFMNFNVLTERILLVLSSFMRDVATNVHLMDGSIRTSSTFSYRKISSISIKGLPLFPDSSLSSFNQSGVVLAPGRSSYTAFPESNNDIPSLRSNVVLPAPGSPTIISNDGFLLAFNKSNSNFSCISRLTSKS